jgi:thimet oligopeptidase
MTEPAAHRTASLGALPFGLAAEELRHRGHETIRREKRRLGELLTGTGSPTVENFLEPLNRILVEVRDVGIHGALIFQVHPDATHRAAGRELSEASDRFFNEFRVHTEVYRRLRGLDLAMVDAATRLGVEKLLREMRRAGVEQPPAQREKVLALQNRLDRLGNEFNGNIASLVRSVWVAGPEALVGLPADYRAAHAPSPEGKVEITTRYPDCYPVMAYAEDSDLRRRLLLEILNVAFPENTPILETILRERRELVRLLGYRDYSEYAVEDKMTKDPAVVAAFLDRVAKLVTRPARDYLARLLSRKQQDHPEATRLEDWDARFWTPSGYYDTKIRQEEWGVDLREWRAYLPYTQVRDGLFALCRELFGMEFRRDPHAEVWHETVEAYDVMRDGAPLGRCYLDLVPRSDKFNHAAQFDVRTGVSGGGLPQGALICNFLDPKTPTSEVRMEYRDVVTFFHEFGHLIHALAGGHGRWLYTTPGSVEWDFVEAPSQLFEEWARDPATLRRFARNPDTGEPIPETLLTRLRESEAFGRASWALRQAALATLSFEIHRRDPVGLDASELFREVWAQRTGEALNPQYHPVASFGHLTGYSAIYYTYLWSLVIARDLLTPFEARGSLTDPTMARRYVEEILAPGGSRPAAELVQRFLGREYTFDAFERYVLAGTKPGEHPG